MEPALQTVAFAVACAVAAWLFIHHRDWVARSESNYWTGVRRRLGNPWGALLVPSWATSLRFAKWQVWFIITVFALTSGLLLREALNPGVHPGVGIRPQIPELPGRTDVFSVCMGVLLLGSGSYVLVKRREVALRLWGEPPEPEMRLTGRAAKLCLAFTTVASIAEVAIGAAIIVSVLARR